MNATISRCTGAHVPGKACGLCTPRRPTGDFTWCPGSRTFIAEASSLGFAPGARLPIVVLVSARTDAEMVFKFIGVDRAPGGDVGGFLFAGDDGLTLIIAND